MNGFPRSFFFSLIFTQPFARISPPLSLNPIFLYYFQVTSGEVEENE